MAGDLGTVGIGNRNPSFSVWLWVGEDYKYPGWTTAWSHQGTYDFQCWTLSLAWSLLILWVFNINPLCVWRKTLFTNWFFTIARRLDCLAVGNKLVIWLGWLRTSVPSQSLADPTERTENMLINYLNGVGRSVVDLCSPTVIDEATPHMWWLIRPLDWLVSSEWRNLIPIKCLSIPSPHSLIRTNPKHRFFI